MKYKNQKIKIDGIVFDSKLEAARYCELKMMKQAKKIRDLKLQPEFILIPSFKKNGKTYRKCSYIADFSYFDVEKGKMVIEDVKGFKTEVFKLKRKLFEYLYRDLTITVITRKDIR